MAIVEKPKENALELSARDIMVQVAEIEVVDDMTFEQCKEYGLAAKDLKKQVEDFFEEPIQKAHEAHKALTAKRKAILDPVKDLLNAVSKKLGAYQDELAREAKRQAEALAKIEAENRRREAESYAENLIDQGHYEAAADQLRHAENLPDVVVKVDTHRPEAAKGGTTRVNWQFEVVDESLLPREFLKPDEAAIRAYIKAKKDRAQIPGVRVYSETKHHV